MVGWKDNQTRKGKWPWEKEHGKRRHRRRKMGRRMATSHGELETAVQQVNVLANQSIGTQPCTAVRNDRDPAKPGRGNPRWKIW